MLLALLKELLHSWDDELSLNGKSRQIGGRSSDSAVSAGDPSKGMASLTLDKHTLTIHGQLIKSSQAIALDERTCLFLADRAIDLMRVFFRSPLNS